MSKLSKFAKEHPDIADLLKSVIWALLFGHNATEKRDIMERAEAMLTIPPAGDEPAKPAPVKKGK